MSEVHITEHELQNFIQSNVWRVLSNELQVWLNDIRAQLEVTEQIDVLRKLQGNAEAVRRALELPQHLLDLISAGGSL